MGDHMLWQSDELSSGFHTFKLRITGTRNANSGGNYIAPDRVDIYGKANAFNTKTIKAVAVELAQTPLDYRVIDAGYSPTLDRVVVVADSPNAMYIVDPNTGDEATVKLASTPKFVSVSPDGNFAVAAQLGLITYVDLKTATILNTFDFPQMITDIVLGNGWIYVEPQGSSWQKLTAIEIATGKESTSTGADFYYGTKFKLLPNGSRLYGATQGISSGGIVSVDVASGVPNVLGEHNGDWYACGKLWVSQDGKRLFSGFGGVFRTAVDRDLDVTPNGRLAQLKYARSIFHSGNAGVVLAIPESRPTPPCPNQGEETADRLLIYDYASLQLVNVVKLPNVGAADEKLPADGRFVFANAQGTKVYVVLQATDKAGLLGDFAIAVGDLTTLKTPAQ
jgi:hypothetical protein